METNFAISLFLLAVMVWTFTKTRSSLYRAYTKAYVDQVVDTKNENFVRRLGYSNIRDHGYTLLIGGAITALANLSATSALGEVAALLIISVLLDVVYSILIKARNMKDDLREYKDFIIPLIETLAIRVIIVVLIAVMQV